MRLWSTTDAADELGVQPRELRRHLRNHDAWRNVGLGGRYMFTEADISKLRKQLGDKPSRARADDDPALAQLDQDPGIDEGLLEFMAYDDRLRARVREDRAEARTARVARLRARMADVLVERYDDEPRMIKHKAVS